MRFGIVVLAMLGLAGCGAYVTKEEFDEAWDQDSDGWPVGEDCNDQNRDFYPGAPDVRGDGCDPDCGVASDQDGDDWPDDADCAPEDPTIFPCADDPADGGGDRDCDGEDTPRDDDCNDRDPNYGADVSQVKFGGSCACPAPQWATDENPVCPTFEE
jgi:hypothetical protein